MCLGLRLVLSETMIPQVCHWCWCFSLLLQGFSAVSTHLQNMTGSHCQLPGNASWYTSCSSPTVCKAWIPGNSSDFLCVECFWLEWWRSLVITQYQLILERPTSMGSQVAASVKSTSHWWNLCCCRDRLLLLQSEGNSKEQDTVWKDVLSWKSEKDLSNLQLLFVRTSSCGQKDGIDDIFAYLVLCELMWF